MAKSRYSGTPIVDDHHFETYSLPVRGGGFAEDDLLLGVKTFEYVVVRGDRMDHLAARFFNEDSYWWIIALVNGISYPFASGGMTVGRRLKIPFDVRDVLDRVVDR